MTRSEITEWRYRIIEELSKDLPATVNDVLFTTNGVSLIYQYKNAEGLVFARNGMWSSDDYYPLVMIAPRYSDESKYNKMCQPNLQAIAEAVKASWEEFCGN